MNATARIQKIQSRSGVVVGVDIAESVFQVCEADAHWRRLGNHRLSRSQFERWFDNRDIALVIMEACGAYSGERDRRFRSIVTGCTV